MNASDQRTRSQKAAAALLARGIYHGKRQSRPAPNSGGLTMTAGPGSAKYQRRRAK
jgi:hypothetical protein